MAENSDPQLPDKEKDPEGYWREYYKREAQTAFKDRDTVKARLRELEGKVLTDEDQKLFDKLKADAAKADEDRKRKEGEFDSLKTQLIERHTGELKSRDDKIGALSTRLWDTVVRAEFGAASELFGGHDQSKTILDVDLGLAALGKYVHVEEDDKDPRGYRVVVKNAKGDTILGKDGNPAPFSEAMAELIITLPNKDRILRGSGKTGSGSSGGSGQNGSRGDEIDPMKLSAQDLRHDPKLRQQLRAQRSKGGMVLGRAFEPAAKS